MHYMLSQGVKKLADIRVSNPDAGGLVVASSIKHAKRLHHMLVTDFKQTASIVTSRTRNPSGIIDDFRKNYSQWIVNVGMISEGTDIPRLQVCCHLSRIKTEMHYRQVLGRILRVTSDETQQAWLFTLAEASLTEFAYRIDQDLPNHSVVISLTEQQELDLGAEQDRKNVPSHPMVIRPEELTLEGLPIASKVSTNIADINEENLYNLALIGGYKEQIVRMFDTHPFNS